MDHATPSCCAVKAPNLSLWQRTDKLLWGGCAVIAASLGLHYKGFHLPFAHEVHHILSVVWPGIVFGILAMAALTLVPRELAIAALGRRGGAGGIGRAVLAGFAFDLCSHGILMVGAKLYERGASLGQLMAFLISSPWNSFSLTFILITMVGWQLTLTFVVLSMIIAFISGMLFDALVARGVLPANPNRVDLPEDFRFWPEARKHFSSLDWSPRLALNALWSGIKESRMVLRWMFLGIIIAAALRVGVDASTFAAYLGPTVAGLFITLAAATVIEVCSEGATPIAADIVTRAAAPGNGFTFLMAGVATDYTEIMVLRQVTGSWKTALLLPLITVPQVLVLGYFLNQF
jgi:hypothetical protein